MITFLGREIISQPDDGHCKGPKHVAVLYVINSIHISTIIKLC